MEQRERGERAPGDGEGEGENRGGGMGNTVHSSNEVVRGTA